MQALDACTGQMGDLSETVECTVTAEDRTVATVGEGEDTKALLHKVSSALAEKASLHKTLTESEEVRARLALELREAQKMLETNSVRTALLEAELSHAQGSLVGQKEGTTSLSSRLAESTAKQNEALGQIQQLQATIEVLRGERDAQASEQAVLTQRVLGMAAALRALEASAAKGRREEEQLGSFQDEGQQSAHGLRKAEQLRKRILQRRAEQARRDAFEWWGAVADAACELAERELREVRGGSRPPEPGAATPRPRNICEPHAEPHAPLTPR